MAPILHLDILYYIFNLLCEEVRELESQTGLRDEVFYRELRLQRFASREFNQVIKQHAYRFTSLAAPIFENLMANNSNSYFNKFLENIKKYTQVLELAIRRIDPIATRTADLISTCERLNHVKWAFIQDNEVSRTSALYLKALMGKNNKVSFVPQHSVVHIITPDAGATVAFQPVVKEEQHGLTYLRNKQARSKDVEFIGPDPLLAPASSIEVDELVIHMDTSAGKQYKYLRYFGQTLGPMKRLALEDHGGSNEMMDLGTELLDYTSLESASLESMDIIGIFDNLTPDTKAGFRYLEIVDCFSRFQPMADDETENGEQPDISSEQTESENDEAPENQGRTDIETVEFTFGGLRNLETLRIFDSWRGIFSLEWLIGIGQNLRELSLRSLGAAPGESYAIAVHELESIQQHCVNVADLEIEFDPSEAEREELQSVLSSFSNLQSLQLYTFDYLWRDDVPQQSTDLDFDAAALFITNLNLMKVGVLFEEITIRACCNGPGNPQGGPVWRAFKLTRDINGLAEINEI